MKTTDKKNLLKWNTLLWLAAMVLPAGFSFALAGTRFPWPLILPLLLLGPMLASNKMLAQASGASTDASGNHPQSR
jgi:fatty acid desaturase